jgi:23S rRNA (pseudouridine1915-N3)-methyltransferase
LKKIDILCVGKLKERYWTDAVAEYAKRLSRFCDFTVTEVKEWPDTPDAPIKEGAALLEKADGYKILLDLSGTPVTSEGFAAKLDAVFTGGANKAHIIIGGSRGVDKALKTATGAIFNFGAVTYPHQLMRVIAAEQIYRAMCILNGVGYHK